ncbi:hypothetical protein PHMEG_00012166 [Phytophthora megakarya]|uniref:Eukaryotic/viral aspartic protease n=1 Tax=Phytophthora megakarya TaxID=4795 RepID=A0A225WC09_9STRA|nr:hypothetical protein PHMEG_00012166 [Phytophthora megakarya]
MSLLRGWKLLAFWVTNKFGNVIDFVVSRDYKQHRRYRALNKKPHDAARRTEHPKAGEDCGVPTVNIYGSITRSVSRLRETSFSMQMIPPSKITGMLHHEKAVLRLDTGAEISIVDTAFPRTVWCFFDSNQIQDWVRIEDNVYSPERRIRIKVALAEALIYFSTYGLMI